MERKGCAEKIYDGMIAQGWLEDQFLDTQRDVSDFDFGFDWYDSSLEIFRIHPDIRLSKESVELFKECGFTIVFVNHTDGMETHYYTNRDYKDFNRVKRS